MKGYNIIVVFDETAEKVLMCRRRKNFIYHLDNYYLEVYVGKLKADREVSGEENELFWCSRDKEFFDTSEFAGEGNIGHIMKYIDVAAERVFS